MIPTMSICQTAHVQFISICSSWRCQCTSAFLSNSCCLWLVTNKWFETYHSFQSEVWYEVFPKFKKCSCPSWLENTCKLWQLNGRLHRLPRHGLKAHTAMGWVLSLILLETVISRQGPPWQRARWVSSVHLSKEQSSMISQMGSRSPTDILQSSGPPRNITSAPIAP